MSDTSMTRRSILMLIAVGGPCTCVGGFGVQAKPARRGCEPDAAHLDALRSRSSSFASSRELHRATEGDFQLLRTSGNKDIDLGLDRALQRLASAFNVTPAFGFDPVEPDNAWASSRKLVENTDGTVGFGTNYFKKWLNYDQSGITVIATCAHEFAHIWMFKSGLFNKVNAGRSDVKRTELHADYLSGFYLGQRKRDNPNASFWSAGEKFRLIGDTNFSSPHHHGTPAERLAAAEAGFMLGLAGKSSAADAFQTGLVYVERR